MRTVLRTPLLLRLAACKVCLLLLLLGSVTANARVNCATERVNNQNVTYFCNTGETCYRADGKWKCRKPAPAGMSCTTCYNNQKRDSDSCMVRGTDMSKLQCVNRVNSELNKCLNTCR